MISRFALHAIAVCSVPLLGAPLLTACAAAPEVGRLQDADLRDAGASAADVSYVADSGVGVQGDDEASAPNFQGCFNGVDENGEGGVDCADSTCALTPPCCIGNGTAMCCAPEGPLHTLSLTGCTDAAHCGEMHLVAGYPEIAAGRLTMVSSTDGDAIVDFPSWNVTSRAERVVLRASVSVRTASSLPVDAAAFGLWPGNASATVNPDVAVVVSATRQDVSLVVGSRIVSARTLVPEATSYELEVEVTGHVSLHAYQGETLLLDEEQSVDVALPVGRSVPVVFGRVTNNEAGAASVTAFSVQRFPCDIPAAITRTGALTFREAPTFDARSVSDPSVVLDGGTTHIAFAARPSVDNGGRSLYVGTLVGSEIQNVHVVATLATVTTDAATDLSGPSLHVNGSQLEMYFAYRVGEVWKLAVLRDILGEPVLHTVNTATGSYDEPTVLGDALLVRLRDGAQTRFVRMDAPASDSGAFSAAAVCGADATCDASTPTSSYVLQNSGSELAFDRDEISAPSVVQTPSTTRIFYAGRRGTRWSIGMLQSSGSGLYFRNANDGDALLSGSGSGLEALSVAAPTAWIESGTLHVVYAGSDGVGWSLFHASEPIRGE